MHTEVFLGNIGLSKTWLPTRQLDLQSLPAAHVDSVFGIDRRDSGSVAYLHKEFLARHLNMCVQLPRIGYL